MDDQPLEGAREWETLKYALSSFSLSSSTSVGFLLARSMSVNRGPASSSANQTPVL